MTIWFDIYLQQLGFHRVAAVGKLVKKKKKESESYIKKKKQYTKQEKNKIIHKIENKHTKQEKEHKKNMKKT